MPSTQKEVTYRPFLVPEEKILLIAQESGEDKDLILAIKQILGNVIVDTWFNTDMLTTFDLNYMFIQLRSKSVSNLVTLNYIDNEDEKPYEFEIDLDKVEVKYTEGHTNKIPITADIGVIMKYPTISVVEKIDPDAMFVTEVSDAIIKACIDKVYDAESVYNMSEETDEEIDRFIASLDTKAYAGIRSFFNTIPVVQYDIKYKNSLDSDRVISLRTLKDFFTWG